MKGRWCVKSNFNLNWIRPTHRDYERKVITRIRSYYCQTIEFQLLRQFNQGGENEEFKQKEYFSF